MRVLVTADIHLGLKSADDGAKRFLMKLQNIGDVDVIVIAGDIAENSPEASPIPLTHHRRAFEMIAKIGCPNVALLAGSHDIWCGKECPDSWDILMNLLYDLSREYGFTYLERENLYVGDIAFCGTMAHYDYSMAEEGLIFDGITVKPKHYASKTPPGFDAPIWGDAHFVRWQYDDVTACRIILEKFEERLKEATMKSSRIFVASHTVPVADVNGHIFQTNLKSRFLNAFSGTKLLAETLFRNNQLGKIAESVSGHTHIRIPPVVKSGIRFRNIGGDYGNPLYEIIEI